MLILFYLKHLSNTTCINTYSRRKQQKKGFILESADRGSDDEREEVNLTQDEVYTIQSTSHHSECEFESKTKMR